MPIDARFFTTKALEEYLVNKTSGNPLSGGLIYFYEDNDRNNPKTVYTISGAPPDYTYVALPNPLTLSAVGTIQDNNGNNVPIYYFPYEGLPEDNNPAVQLYYIVVQDSSGNVQFTRQAWPNLSAGDDPIQDQANIENELSNPQFAKINFANANPFTFTSPAGNPVTTTIPIAPDWDLVVISSAAGGTVTVTRTAVAGSAGYSGNPPYTLTLAVGGANILSCTLVQTLSLNPNIWSPAAGGTNGYINAGVLLGPGSSLSIGYKPNGLAVQTIGNFNNAAGTYEYLNETIQLSPAANPSTPDNGGQVQIILDFPVGSTTEFSNVQIVGLDSNVQTVVFDQATVNRQIDQLFNYYNPWLQYKPISNFLVGWDFPYNPAQFLGVNAGPFATGANTSNYFWDQTIIFQSADNSISVSQPALAGYPLRITAGANTRFAVVQYLPMVEATDILNQYVSANLAALTNQVGGIPCTISLWYSTNAGLPNIGANASIVATLDANGYPATRNNTATWFEIPRSDLPKAQFTVAAQGAFTTYNDYGFNYFSFLGGANLANVRWFAIVIGFGQLNVGNTVDILSASVTPGLIPTRPAPKSANEHLLDCERYYAKSFLQGTVPAAALGRGTGEYYGVRTAQDGTTGNYFLIDINLRTPMFKVPTVTVWNPVVGGGNANQPYDTSANASFTTPIGGDYAINITPKHFDIFQGNGVIGAVGDAVAAHWVADARLGF